MANELKITGYVTGQTVTVTILDTSLGVLQSGLATTEVGTGNYVGSVTAGLIAGSHIVNFFNGATAIASGIIYWDGEQEVDFYPVPAPIREGSTLSVKVDKCTTRAHINSARRAYNH